MRRHMIDEEKLLLTAEYLKLFVRLLLYLTSLFQLNIRYTHSM